MVDISKVTMLILGIVTISAGFVLAFNLMPSYKGSFDDRVCHVFAFTRGIVFRDKGGDYIPNEYEVRAYDSFAKYIPLPCKSKSLSIDITDYDDINEFKTAFIKMVGYEIIRCDNTFRYNTIKEENELLKMKINEIKNILDNNIEINNKNYIKRVDLWNIYKKRCEDNNIKKKKQSDFYKIVDKYYGKPIKINGIYQYKNGVSKILPLRQK